MLDEQKVKHLSKVEKQKLDELMGEYEEATKAHSVTSRNVSKETQARYHQAVKNLSGFISRHHLRY